MQHHRCRARLCFPTYVSARTVIVTSLNFSKAAVGEVELLRFVVDCQPVGCQNVGAHDDPHVFPGQIGPHDAGLLLVPVGPEHQTETDREALGRPAIGFQQRGKKNRIPSQRLCVKMKM